MESYFEVAEAGFVALEAIVDVDVRSLVHRVARLFSQQLLFYRRSCHNSRLLLLFSSCCRCRCFQFINILEKVVPSFRPTSGKPTVSPSPVGLNHREREKLTSSLSLSLSLSLSHTHTHPHTRTHTHTRTLELT